MIVAAAFHGMSADSPAGGLPAGGGVAPPANVPDRQRRDGFPQPVIRRKYSVVAMPVLPRRRDEIGKLVAFRGTSGPNYPLSFPQCAMPPKASARGEK